MQGQFSWLPCVVLSYNTATEMYTVQWDGTGRTKEVKRLNLVFDSESHTFFRHRLRQARKRRAEVESEATFQLYVASLKFSNLSIHTVSWKNRILALVDKTLAAQLPVVVEGTFKALLEDYKHAVKCAIVTWQLRSEEGRAYLATHEVRGRALLYLRIY